MSEARHQVRCRPHAVTIDQEGHRVPPVVAFESGRWADEFAEPFISASRTPWERRGDLEAQIGANAVGVSRMAELVSGIGAASFRSQAASLLDYGERRMTAALRHLPEGAYAFADFMELGDVDVAIRVVVTIADGRLTADFTGSR